MSRAFEKIYVSRYYRPTLLQEYLDKLPPHSQLFPDAYTVLSGFKALSLKLGIITNGREDLQSAIIQSCGLQEIMGTILISKAIGVRKPDPAIFNAALETYRCRPPLRALSAAFKAF